MRRNRFEILRGTMMIVAFGIASLASSASFAGVGSDAVDRDPWCLPLPLSDENRQFIQMQQNIHEQLFSDSYDVCEDMFWALDDDVRQNGQWITGFSAAGEPLAINVLHIAVRIEDWADVGDFTPEEVVELNDAGATVTRFVGEVYGPLSALSISGVAYSADVNGGQRTAHLLPAYEHGAAAQLLTVDPCPEGQGDPLYVQCTGDAADDRDDCRDGAYDTYDGCLRDLFWETAFWGGLDCILGAATLGGGFIGAGCVYGRTAQLGFQCDATFADDMANCIDQYEDDMHDCCDQAVARRDAEQKQAQPWDGVESR